MLHKTVLGREAVEYIASCLSAGYSLARLLLNLPIDQGRVVSFLPADVSAIALVKFETGGVAFTSETKDHLIHYIGDYLQEEPMTRIAIFESDSRVGDPNVGLHKAGYVAHDSEIFYFASGSMRSSDAIDEAVGSARYYPFIGVLTSLGDQQAEISDGALVTTNWLEELAMRTQCIIVGAYDEEAFLIWKR